MERYTRPVTTKTGPRRKVDVPLDPETAQEEFIAQVGDAIRRERLARSWTQAHLAERAQLSANHVARLERGEVGATFYVMHRIGRALGVDVAVLAPPSAPSRARRTAS